MHRHGLRLASKFGGYVSVELHTDTAHDIKAIEYYGKRFHEICPEQFIVKVPYTAEGLNRSKTAEGCRSKDQFYT